MYFVVQAADSYSNQVICAIMIMTHSPPNHVSDESGRCRLYITYLDFSQN